MKSAAQDALDEMRGLGALVHVEGSLGFVAWNDVLVVLLISPGKVVENVRKVVRARAWRDARRGRPPRARRANGEGLTSTERSRLRREKLRAQSASAA